MLNKYVKSIMIFLSVLILLQICACSSGLNSSQKGATNYTENTNRSVYTQLNFTDKNETANAQQGCIQSVDGPEISDKNGNIIFSSKRLNFISDNIPSPDTVNPSLWSYAKINKYCGLFEICPDKLYQIRGFDITNLTVIISDNGYIIVDPMSNVECANKALEFLYDTLGEKPIKAVILTNPSVENFAGIEVFTKDLNTKIIAPKNFEESAKNDILFCSKAKEDINSYEKGTLLENNYSGCISISGTADNNAEMTVSYKKPHEIINEDKTLVIDGVNVEFSIANTKEKSDSMNLYLADTDTLYLTGDFSQGMSDFYGISKNSKLNLDLLSKMLSSLSEKYSANVQSLIQAHTYAHNSNGVASDYIHSLAKLYRYIYNSTVQQINLGYTKSKIISEFKLPDAFTQDVALRQAISTLDKLVSNTYDSLANEYETDYRKIKPIPDKEKAKKTIEYMGGDIKVILNKAKEDFNKGEYQWVCEITHDILAVDENNSDAKYLCADALEQMAYLSESATDRNLYLSYAKQLREGNNQLTGSAQTLDENTAKLLTTEDILDKISLSLNLRDNEDIDITFNLYITDTNERYVVQIQNSAFVYYKNMRVDDAKASLHLNKNGLAAIFNKDISAQNSLITIYGDKNVLNVLNKL